MLVSLLVLFDPEDGGAVFPPRLRLAFIGLQGVISQKIELFIINFNLF
jgi:hypothetical protein